LLISLLRHYFRFHIISLLRYAIITRCWLPPYFRCFEAIFDIAALIAFSPPHYYFLRSAALFSPISFHYAAAAIIADYIRCHSLIAAIIRFHYIFAADAFAFQRHLFCAGRLPLLSFFFAMISLILISPPFRHYIDAIDAMLPLLISRRCHYCCHYAIDAT